MNPKVNYLLVGGFVIVICIATLIFALWLAFGYGEATQESYQIYMSESVAGLGKNAVVKFNGVNVGSITDIQLDPADPSIVMITVAIDDDAPVTSDTRATLMSQGLTGLSYINLTGGNKNSPPLKPLRGQKYAVIPTNPSLLLRLDASIGKLSASLDSMSHSVEYLLRDENQKNFTKLLKNMADMSSALNQQLPEALQSANQTLNSLNSQTLPTLNQSLLMVQGSLPSLNAFTQQLSEDPSMLLRGTKPVALGPGEKYER